MKSSKPTRLQIIIYLSILNLWACVEIESDFGKQKMPGDLLVTSSRSIDKIYWQQSTIYYLTYSNSGSSLVSTDILTKETKVILPSYQKVSNVTGSGCLHYKFNKKSR